MLNWALLGSVANLFLSRGQIPANVLIPGNVKLDMGCVPWT